MLFSWRFKAVTVSQTIQTIIELVLVVLVFTGFIYEDKIVKFEKRLFKKIKNFLEVIR